MLTSTSISYTYDALYRLTRADYIGGNYFAYAYDAVGNRTSEVACTGATPCAPIITTYSYGDANRLSSVNGQPYTWDANGNLLAGGVLTYTYDAANRLISTTTGLTTPTFTYNGLGDRVNPVVNGVVTTYTLDLAAALTQAAGGRWHVHLPARSGQRPRGAGDRDADRVLPGRRPGLGAPPAYTVRPGSRQVVS